MRRFFLATALVALFASMTAAQDEYNKVEVFAGYSHNRVDVGPVQDFGGDVDFNDIFDEREGYNGFEVSVTGNLSRYVGLRFDYSYHQRSVEFGTDNSTARLHNFLAGVQFKDNLKEGRKFKPFGHVLAGVARYAVDLSEFDQNVADFDDAGFAMGIGGGLDIQVHRRVDIRAIQFDYNPMRFNFSDFGAPIGTVGTPTPVNVNNEGTRTLHNFRFGTGIVFR